MHVAGHIPVLAREVVEALNLAPDSKLVDATFGRGGHARLCLKQLGPKGRLLALDRDPQAIAHAKREFAGDDRLRPVHCAFDQIDDAVRDWLGDTPVDAVLMDIGVSSPQLDEAVRGFSFSQEGPLDMRMDSTQGASAREWLLETSEDDVSRSLRTLGEERFSRRIAAAIKQALQEDGLHTTTELAALVERVVPTREKNKHPATRTFQAIRIAVNGELAQLREALPKAFGVLRSGGRLVVISFHSLEDRIVKNFMRELSRGDNFPPDLPVTADQLKPRARLIGKARRASEAEVNENPRSRSAVLRVVEKL